MFQVTVTNEGGKYWLRGTTWAFHADRANSFETTEAATAALEKARKFMKPAQFKLAKIEQV